MPVSVAMNAAGGDMFLFFASLNGASSLSSITVTGGTTATGTYVSNGVSYTLRFTGTGLAALGATDISGSVSQIEVYATASPGTIIETMTYAQAYSMASALNLDFRAVLGSGDTYTGGGGNDRFLHGDTGGATLTGGAGNDTFVVTGTNADLLTGQSMAGDVINGGSTTGETNTIAFIGRTSGGFSTDFDMRGAAVSGINVVATYGRTILDFNWTQIAPNSTLAQNLSGALWTIHDSTLTGAHTIDTRNLSFVSYEANGAVAPQWFQWWNSGPTFNIDASASNGDATIYAPNGIWSSVTGGNGNDTINGATVATMATNSQGIFGVVSNLIYASAGNDTIAANGHAGVDYSNLSSGIVAHWSNGGGTVTKTGLGTDVVTGADYLKGSTGSDVFYITAPNATDIIDGGGGVGRDLLDLSSQTADTIVTRSGGGSAAPVGLTTWRLADLELGSGNDTVHDFAVEGRIDGGGGNNTLITAINAVYLGETGTLGSTIYASNFSTIVLTFTNQTLRTSELGTHSFTAQADAFGQYSQARLNYTAMTGNLTFTQTAKLTAPPLFPGAQISTAAVGTVSGVGLSDTFSGFKIISGGGGQDTFTLFADSGLQKVDGGGGFNTLIVNGTHADIELGGSHFENIDQVVLGGGSNTISVVEMNNQLVANLDFHYLYGGSAGSTNTMTLGIGGGYLISTGGINHMHGMVTSASYQFALANASNIFVGGVGASDMHGGAGFNTYYTGLTDTVFGAGKYNTQIMLAANANLVNGTNLTNVQQVILNGGTNTVDMTGSTDFVYLYGGAGTNTMTLGAGGGYMLSTGGTNHMYGGAAGTSVFVGGVGASDMHGGGGNNVYYAGANDTVFGAGAYNTFISTAGTGLNLTLDSAGLQNVQQYIFYVGANTLDASAATAQVIVYGGAGNDTLGGGKGNDYFDGGAGSNRFVVKDDFGIDTIRDWAAGSGNKLDMTALASFGVHSMAQLNITLSGADTVIAFGNDTITLTNVTTALTASDFLFA